VLCLPIDKFEVVLVEKLNSKID
jgi:hypothetical protein